MKKWGLIGHLLLNEQESSETATLELSWGKSPQAVQETMGRHIIFEN